jgi:hypothetical protein
MHGIHSCYSATLGKRLGYCMQKLPSQYIQGLAHAGAIRKLEVSTLNGIATLGLAPIGEELRGRGGHGRRLAYPSAIRRPGGHSTHPCPKPLSNWPFGQGLTPGCAHMTQNTAAATRIHPTSIPNSRFKALAPPAFTPAFTSAPIVLGRTSSPHCPRLSSSVDRWTWAAASRSRRGVECRFSEPPWAASSRTLLYMGIACWAKFCPRSIMPGTLKSMVVVEKVSSYQVFN